MCYAYKMQKYENKLKHLKINIKTQKNTLQAFFCILFLDDIQQRKNKIVIQ